jgi:tetratricopeptide (TPR) repeat protein
MKALALVVISAFAPEPQEVAREHYRKALAHYDLRQFDRAIAEFQQAYAISGAPELLFNMAQAHRLRGDCKHALHFYRTYLRLVPDAPNRDDVQARIGEMQRQVAAANVVRERPLLVVAEDNPGAALEVAGIVTGASGLALVGAGVAEYHSGRHGASLFCVVGGVALAGGGVLYWLGTRETHVTPAPVPAGSGIVVSGRF